MSATVSAPVSVRVNLSTISVALSSRRIVPILLPNKRSTEDPLSAFTVVPAEYTSFIFTGAGEPPAGEADAVPFRPTTSILPRWVSAGNWLAMPHSMTAASVEPTLGRTFDFIITQLYHRSTTNASGRHCKNGQFHCQ